MKKTDAKNKIKKIPCKLSSQKITLEGPLYVDSKVFKKIKKVDLKDFQSRRICGWILIIFKGKPTWVCQMGDCPPETKCTLATVIIKKDKIRKVYCGCF